MNMRINPDYFQPDTLANMIADILSDAHVDMLTVEKLTSCLEERVCKESAIDYLVEAGVNANLAVGLFED